MKRDFADYENMFTFHTNTSGGGTGWPNAGGRTLLLREMLESDVFRERFILRCADLLNHLWSGERVVGRIDAMAAVIRAEIPRHLERWSWAAVQERDFGLPHKEEDEPLNLEHWERNVEVMRTFGSGRPEQLRGQLMDHFGVREWDSRSRCHHSEYRQRFRRDQHANGSFRGMERHLFQGCAHLHPCGSK